MGGHRKKKKNFGILTALHIIDNSKAHTEIIYTCNVPSHEEKKWKFSFF